jgi:3-oxoacid CoA-transferase B subunit
MVNEGQAKVRIAKRVANWLKDGSVVNLGVGIPTMVVDYLPDGKKLYVQSENGVLGVGPSPSSENVLPNLINAGRKPITVIPGASYFDSTLSFGMIRGGHLDATVIGALQVSEQGDLANWQVPGKDVLGPGGAMDLVVGAKEVIVATQHTAKDGTPKIVNRCSMPITAFSAVHVLVTEYAIFTFTSDSMSLVEMTSDITLERLKEITPAAYTVSTNLVIEEV